MVVGRLTELDRVDAFLERVERHDGQALVIRGAAGIGKTVLLQRLLERSGPNVTALRVTGVETESELPFVGLSDLLTPVLEHRATLPAPQAAALAAAVALGPPAPGDRLAVCVAALAVLRAAAATRPVLVAVDDLHWLDAASRECVLYVARRAGGSLAVALAVRDPCGGWLEQARLPELTLGPLDRDDSVELLDRAFPDLAPSVAAEVCEAAAGNPLALVELAASLTPDQRRGMTDIELPIAPAGRLQEAFASRINELEASARRALLVLAAYDGDELPPVSAACVSVGTDVSHLADAEAHGLVRLAPGRISFSHPIVRGAAYHAAPPAERRRIHAALAGVLDGDRRVWHLAAATVGTNESVAAELEALAGRAAARRGYAAAAAALQRAAALSRGADVVAQRLLAAAQAAASAGDPDRALTLLEGVAEGGPRSERRRAQHLRGRMLIWRGRGTEGIEVLVREADDVKRDDRALGSAMLADAAIGAATINAHLQAEELARKALALLDNGEADAVRAAVLTMAGWVLVVRGKAAEARPILGTAAQLTRGLDPLGPDWPWLHLLLRARIGLGDFEPVQLESTALCERAREAAALGVLSGALLVAADVAFRLGDWEAAEQRTAEAIRTAGETGQPSLHGLALTTRSRLLAARGMEDESRAAALDALEIAEREQITAGLRHVHAALGFLALSAGRVEDAIAELEVVERLVRGRGIEEPTNVPWLPDMVEAYARAGRHEDARRALAMLAPQAASSDSPVAGAAMARCRGILETGFDQAFAEALALDDLRPMPFERARTLLALGRRLHRARRRSEARDRLREALAGFERLGATAWARQARDELRAAGGRRRQSADGLALTPQERRVAAAVRRGASNREIASELFLTPKTIEFHLRQIYRKLGVHSRPQLVAALSRPSADDQLR